MNFLAHLYLSGDSDPVKIGNFIGDYVKGKKYLNYPLDIQKGIILHRSIDHFTDCHPIVSESSNRFREGYNRYSGVVVDVIYDHFLAKNWQEYHSKELKIFTSSTHEVLIKKYLVLPLRVKKFLPFLIKSRRLESYATLDGIHRALEIMSNHTTLPNKADYALGVLESQYEALEEEFKTFFPDIMEMVRKDHDITLEAPDGWHPNGGK
jgi:acyl carrier protein phosphodiesterase